MATENLGPVISAEQFIAEFPEQHQEMLREKVQLREQETVEKDAEADVSAAMALDEVKKVCEAYLKT